MHIDTLVDNIPTTKEVRKRDLREVIQEINESPLPITIKEHIPRPEALESMAREIREDEDRKILGILDRLGPPKK